METQRSLAPALAVAALLGLASVAAAATESVPPPSASPAPKTHVLFLGADLAVEKDRQFLPVESVAEDTLIARGSDRAVKVRIRSDLPLQIKETIKVAAAGAVVEGFKAEPAFTPAADPLRRIADAVGMASAAAAMQDVADAGVRNAESGAGYASAMAANASGPEERAMWSAQASRAGAELDAARTSQAANTVASGDLGQVAAGGSAMGRQEGQPDALRVAFAVTAAEELSQPHYAVIARVRDPGSKPGQFRKWVYVRALDRMGAGETRRVLVFQGGFPPGYTLEQCDVHLYDGTREYATNLSRRRVEITADEAHQFHVVSYLTANKGRSVGASPAGPALAAAPRHRLLQVDPEAVYHVRVSKGGQVLAVFEDADGKRPLKEAAIREALQSIRYFPALENGRAVESTVRVRVGELTAL